LVKLQASGEVRRGFRPFLDFRENWHRKNHSAAKNHSTTAASGCGFHISESMLLSSK